jgi:hypothetical protein
VYACAYQLDTLVQGVLASLERSGLVGQSAFTIETLFSTGKLYLTEHHMCFHSNIVGFETVV